MKMTINEYTDKNKGDFEKIWANWLGKTIK